MWFYVELNVGSLAMFNTWNIQDLTGYKGNRYPISGKRKR